MKTYSRKKIPDNVETFDSICRLCLTEVGARRCIFSENDGVPLSAKINVCLSTQVLENDGMPSEICIQCAMQLENFYKFRKKCEESETTLRKLLKTPKNLVLTNIQQNKDDFVTTNSGVGMMDSPDVKSPRSTHHSENRGQEKENITVEHSVSSNVYTDSMNSTLASNKNPAFNGSVSQESVMESFSTYSINNEENLSRNDMEKKSATKTCVSLSRENFDPFQLNENMQGGVKKFEVQKDCHDKCDLVNKLITISTAQCEQKKHKCDVAMTNTIVPKGDLGTFDASLIFKCDKCPKRFSRQIDLKWHSSVHTEQRGFVCNVCEKWFPSKTSFKRHELIHTGERPFVCLYCTKSFTQAAILSRHMRVHTGEKPFKCDYCEKTFRHRESLVVHLRQHPLNGNVITRQFHCSFCDKSFCHQSGLSRHLSVHAGKSFTCEVCLKVFTDKSSVRRHLKHHLEVELKIAKAKE